MRNSLIPAPYDWADARTEDKSRPVGYLHDSRTHKQEQLRSSLDTQHYALPDRPSDCIQPPASNPRERKQRELGLKPCEPEACPPLLSFRLTRLGPEVCEWQVRKLFELVHVVKAEVDLDNITGQCRGSALVQVRSHVQSDELVAVRRNAASIGWDMQLHTPEVKRRAQYKDLSRRNFLDPGTEELRTEYAAPRDADPSWREGTEDLYRWTQLRKS